MTALRRAGRARRVVARAYRVTHGFATEIGTQQPVGDRLSHCGHLAECGLEVTKYARRLVAEGRERADQPQRYRYGNGGDGSNEQRERKPHEW